MTGRLFVIAAPSGAGKTSLVKALLDREPQLRLSISHTTRPKRPHEEDGRHYYFVGRPEFEKMLAENAFLEHARVYDHWYGTSHAALQLAFGAGHDVILEIDWQGARQVRERMPECRTIFILPPSRHELERRLIQRGTDSPEVIARRMREAEEHMRHYAEFDYVVVNDRFETAVADLRRIVRGQGDDLRPDRSALEPLVADLLGGGASDAPTNPATR